MNEAPITQYRQYRAGLSWRSRLRSGLRATAVFALSVPRRIDRTSGWIRFPFYHHVFDDERRAFARHLDYLKSFGDLISLDEAVSLLERGSAIEGRFFCVTFDDGNKDAVTNALPILAEKNVRAAFFLPVSRIGGPPETLSSPQGRPQAVEYLNWDDCRKLVAAGMIVGSHSYSHAHLLELPEHEVMREMRDSKQRIEKEVGRACEHFCCPWGRPKIDFDVDRDLRLARMAGYRSFSTSQRGAMRRGDSPYLIRRDELNANWGCYQLRYFLSR